ncbi:cation diffusion facilitator family transporter [Bifidobacterium aerophilum]|uniref:Cation diffusion facilitator family transporter n=1 Tax=Bifidobacterium aerophilum TaxID=1798155 RepID=A0A6N9Z3M2_9BIFI|nr:cation diffusion facilitator family transporter [Bifidobacterium aerophilum]NEG89247.1 cation diffusion facilitator family transporter [Bifidobacterium aerophilum]
MNESQNRHATGDAATLSGDTDIRQQTKHAGAAVKAALAANIGVAAAKLCAAAFTGSSAMLSESVHSIADCSNEIVLMIGGRFSKHRTDGDHPFGLYRAKYLASFVVATLLFFVGGFFSTSEAIKKIVAVVADPALRDANQMELTAALVVVVVSACLEGYGLHSSAKEANERMARTRTPHMGIFRFWRRTKSAELASVIMEDTLALIGLAFAGTGIALAIVLDDELWDAIGGLMVGLVLIAGSLLLAFKSGSLLLGETVDRVTRDEIVAAVTSTPGVDRLLNMQTIHMSEDDILLCLKVETSKLDRDYDVETVDKIERSVRGALPWYRFEIYVEPDVFRPEAHRGTVAQA